MLESYQQKLSLTAKALAICASGMAVGFGTCGLTILTGGVGDGPFSSFVAVAGAVLFFVSLLGGIVTVLIYLVNRIMESFQK